MPFEYLDETPLEKPKKKRSKFEYLDAPAEASAGPSVIPTNTPPSRFEYIGNAPESQGGGEPPGSPLAGQALEVLKKLNPMPSKIPASIEEMMEMISPPTLKTIDTPTARRVAGGFGSGAVASASAMAGAVPAAEASFGIDTPVGRVSGEAAKYLQGLAKELAPENPKFIDQVVSGAGSMATFLVPATGAAKAATMLPRFGALATKLAPAIGTGVSTVLESATEAGQVFMEGEQTVGRDGAAKNAQKTFFSNLLLVGLTNKLGLFGDKAKGLAKALISAPFEAIQEAGQEIISSVAQDKPINWGNVATSAGVGGIVGAGAGGAMALMQPKVRDDSTAPAAPGQPPEGGPPLEVIKPEKGAPKTEKTAYSNPIDPALPPAEKVKALEALSNQNAALIDEFISDVDTTLGTKSKKSFKTAENILGKAVRPEIKSVDPAFDVEHVRDALRFRTELENLEDFGKIVQKVQEKGWKVIKMDTAKMSKPREWGWRMAAMDIMMPNGQIIEYQAYPKEFAAVAKKASHTIYEKWRNTTDEARTERWQEYQKDLEESRQINDTAWQEYLRKVGQDESAALASWSNLEASLSSVTGSKLSLRSSGENVPLFQEPPTKIPKVLESESSTITRPEPGSFEIIMGAPPTTERIPGQAQNVKPPFEFVESPGVPSKETQAVNPQEVDKFFQEEAAQETRKKVAAANAQQKTKELTSREIETIREDADAIMLLQRESGKLMATSPIFQRNFIRERVAQLRTDLKTFIQERIPKSKQNSLLVRLGVTSDPKSLQNLVKQAQEASLEAFMVPQRESTRQTVDRTTGVNPERRQLQVQEDQALKNQIMAEARGSKIGFKAGVKEGTALTKEEMMTRFRSGQQQVADTIEFIKSSLPVEERGRFMTAAANATSLKKHYSIFARVVERLDQMKAAELRSEIKDFTKPSDKIPVDYQKRLEGIREGIDLSKPSTATLAKLKSLQDFISKHGEPLGINPKKVEALKRLTRKNLKDLTTEELTELRDQVKSLQELGKLKLELKWKYNVREWKRETQKLADSTVNVDPLLSGKEKLDRSRAEIIRFYMDTMHTMRVADMLDGYNAYKGENVRHLKELANREDQATLSYRNKMAEFLDAGQKIKSEWTQDELDAMAFHVYSEMKAFDQAQTLIDVKGWKAEPKLTPEMRKMIDLMREIVGRNGDRTAAVYEEILNQPFQKVENYFPIKYEKEFNLISPATIEQNRYRTTKANRGFTFGRKKGVTKVPRTDLFNVLEEALSEQEWWINMQPKLENLSYLVKSEEYAKASGELGQYFWKNVLDVVARRGWSSTAHSNFMVRQARLNLQKAVLGYKLSSIFMQPMAIFDAMAFTAARHGPRTTQDVVTEFAKSWLIPGHSKAFIGQSPALQVRGGGEEAIAETFEAAKRSGKFYRSFIEGGMALLQKADIMTAAGIEKGVYKALLRNGVKPAEAIQEADFIMNLVSGSNNVTYRPHILSRGEGARAWFTFQNFFLNRWGVLAHDLIQSGLVKGNYKQKISAMVGLGVIMAGNIAEDEARRQLYQFVSGKERKPASAAVTAMLTIPTAIPFFGNIIDSAFQGRGASITPPVLRVVEDGFKGLFQAFKAKKKKSRRRAALKAIEAPLTLGLGIPGTAQAFDLIERAMTK
jgi:hypothetical protein